VRAKYPQLSAHQVINRLLATARAPARGVDNQVGHGIVDPVAALTYDLPAGEVVGPQHFSAPLVLAPPKVGRDMAPVWVAGGGGGEGGRGPQVGGPTVCARSGRARSGSAGWGGIWWRWWPWMAARTAPRCWITRGWSRWRSCRWTRWPPGCVSSTSRWRALMWL